MQNRPASKGYEGVLWYGLDLSPPVNSQYLMADIMAVADNMTALRDFVRVIDGEVEGILERERIAKVAELGQSSVARDVTPKAGPKFMSVQWG